jgi:hypothetical protein
MADAAGAWSGFHLLVPVEALANPLILAAMAALGVCALVLPIALYFTLHED